MIEGFLLDWIDAEAARSPVGGQDYFVVDPGSDVAEAALSIAQFALAWAEIALNPAIIDCVPIGG